MFLLTPIIDQDQDNVQNTFTNTLKHIFHAKGGAFTWRGKNFAKTKKKKPKLKP